MIVLNNNIIQVFDESKHLRKEIILTTDSTVTEINESEFKLNGPSKCYSFKIASKQFTISNWVHLIQSMITTINKTMSEIITGISTDRNHLYDIDECSEDEDEHEDECAQSLKHKLNDECLISSQEYCKGIEHYDRSKRLKPLGDDG